MENSQLTELLRRQNTEFIKQITEPLKAKYIALKYPIEDGQLVQNKLNVTLKDRFLGYLANINCIDEPKFPTHSTEEKDGKIIAFVTIEFGLYEGEFYPFGADYSIPFLFENENDFETQLLAALEIHV